MSNLFKRETLSGEFLQVNRYLVDELKALGLWTEEIRNRLKRAEGSVQDIDGAARRSCGRSTARRGSCRCASLIDMAADRGAFIDQSQSLNLFMESPTIGKLSSMYLYAWKQGLKTTYYLRSRPATRIAKTTVEVPRPARPRRSPVDAPAVEPAYTDAEAIACSLENPESCEACQ